MAAHVETTLTSMVDDAIARVLHAEQAARDAVAQCAADAERMRQDARARAHAIAERAAARVARVHRWTDDAIRTRVDRLNRERETLRQPIEPDPGEPARLARALDQLAAEITGEGATP
jgi:hypothetical protein